MFAFIFQLIARRIGRTLLKSRLLCVSESQVSLNPTMPGVDLELMAASEDQIAPLTILDDECSESGLEAVIGDLLADSIVDDPPDKDGRSTDEEVARLELTLQCAVQEIHCDLKAFGEHIGARLKEAVAQVAPAFEAIAALQEENVRLQLQQETLTRQIEALCHALGLPAPQLQPNQDHQELETPNKVQSDGSPEPIPHPPTFALQRSSSTSSQISRSNSMVYFRIFCNIVLLEEIQRNFLPSIIFSWEISEIFGLIFIFIQTLLK